MFPTNRPLNRLLSGAFGGSDSIVGLVVRFQLHDTVGHHFAVEMAAAMTAKTIPF